MIYTEARAGHGRHAATLPCMDSSEKSHLDCHIYGAERLARSHIAYDGKSTHGTPCTHNFGHSAPLWFPRGASFEAHKLLLARLRRGSSASVTGGMAYLESTQRYCSQSTLRPLIQCEPLRCLQRWDLFFFLQRVNSKSKF